MPVCESEQPKEKADNRAQPVKNTGRLPTTSAIAPDASSVHPAVKAKIEAGHSSRLLARFKSAAIRGNPTVRRPEPRVLRKETPATVATTTEARTRDIGGVVGGADACADIPPVRPSEAATRSPLGSNAASGRMGWISISVTDIERYESVDSSTCE